MDEPIVDVELGVDVRVLYEVEDVVDGDDEEIDVVVAKSEVYKTVSVGIYDALGKRELDWGAIMDKAY